MKYVHYNKCTGGHAFDEIDGKTYCLGQTDAYYEDEVYLSECKKCPRLLKNNEDKIEEYAKEERTMNEFISIEHNYKMA